MKTLGIIAAALGGVAVGAALGILLAPDKGANTRELIKRYLREHGIKLHKEKLEEVVDEIADEIRSVQA